MSWLQFTFLNFKTIINTIINCELETNALGAIGAQRVSCYEGLTTYGQSHLFGRFAPKNTGQKIYNNNDKCTIHKPTITISAVHQLTKEANERARTD